MNFSTHKNTIKAQKIFPLALCLTLAGCKPENNQSVAPTARATTPTRIMPLVTIVQSPDIRSIDHFLSTQGDPKKTLILFDIDNTIAEPETELGSDQWFYAMVKERVQAGMKEDDAVDSTVGIFSCLQRHTKLVPVESITTAYIKQLQAQGFTTLGFTARSCPNIDRTIEQLKDIDIDFACNKSIAFDVAIREGKYPACYKAGIVFCGSNSKGEVLLDVFKTTNYQPDHVIFIDDKFKNILSVQNSLENEGIQFVGIRYDRLDKKVKSFSLEKTKNELHYFCSKHPEALSFGKKTEIEN